MVHRPDGGAAVATGARPFALALGLGVSPVVRRAGGLLPAAALLLELNVDGQLGLGLRGAAAGANSVPAQTGPDGEEQAAQLPLERLVEVEVDEGVVDVRAFGEEGRENEALGSHVPRILVEDEEEGHNGVRGPGDHETQADAEKHLEWKATHTVTGAVKKQDTRLIISGDAHS